MAPTINPNLSPNPYPMNYLLWADIERDSDKLAMIVQSKGTWDGIVAITRGGMVPAAIVASKLNIRNVMTIQAGSYDDKRQGMIEVVLRHSFPNAGRGLVVIDDLVDTGTTAMEVRKILPLAHYACLYAKPAGMSYADSFVKEIPQEEWIVFPWEE